MNAIVHADYAQQGAPTIAVVLAKKKLGWATHPSVFFISTTCLPAWSVLIHTKQRRTP
jgi:hypothetical protein